MDPQQPPAPLPTPPPGYSPPPMAWQAPEIETGPAPGVRFASPASRLLAYIVDVLILGVITVVISIVLFTVIGLAAANDNSAIAALGGLTWFGIVVVLSLAYFPYYWRKTGQTPGMKMFRLRVVRDVDGGPISGTAAVLRLLGYWVNQAVLYIGFIWIFVDKRRRGWHDLIAGTVVIEQ